MYVVYCKYIEQDITVLFSSTVYTNVHVFGCTDLYIHFLFSFLFHLVNHPDRILQIKTVDVVHVYCKCFVMIMSGYIVHTTRTYPSFCCIERLGLSSHGKHSGHT